MWTCGTLIFLIPAVIVTVEILSPQRADLRKESWAEFQRMQAHSLNGVCDLEGEDCVMALFLAQY
jgi:hypothetical protein